MKYPIILVMLAAAACTPKYIPVKEKTIRTDTTIFRDVEVPVIIEGSAVNLNMDSLLNAWYKVYGTTVNRTIVKTDPTLQTKLTLFYDSLGKLVAARCETLEKEHKLKLQEKERRITELQETVVRQEKTFGEKLRSTVYSIVGALAFIVVLVVIAIILVKRMSS